MFLSYILVHSKPYYIILYSFVVVISKEQDKSSAAKKIRDNKIAEEDNKNPVVLLRELCFVYRKRSDDIFDVRQLFISTNQN